MSSRAKRVKNQTVVSFPWNAGRADQDRHATAPPSEPPVSEAQLAEVEREAYGRGHAQGEIAGAEAAGQRGDALVQRLAQTLEELTVLRTEMIRQTERQMVELALAVARRIVHREVSLDNDLLFAMARVALERLGDSARVTVRLHPDEYEAAGAGRLAPKIGTNVMVLADPRVERGGCRVESDLGAMDVGVDAQIQEIARALLGEDQPREAASNVVTISGRRRVDPDEMPEAERKPA
jgi:flagellar assembly protein FliH